MNKLYFQEIEKYINSVASAFITPISNMESIRCARRVDHIYIELMHEDGTVRYFDISGMDVSEVGIMIGHIIANDHIHREIENRVAKKEIRKIFK